MRIHLPERTYSKETFSFLRLPVTNPDLDLSKNWIGGGRRAEDASPSSTLFRVSSWTRIASGVFDELPPEELVGIGEGVFLRGEFVGEGGG